MICPNLPTQGPQLALELERQRVAGLLPSMALSPVVQQALDAHNGAQQIVASQLANLVNSEQQRLQRPPHP